MATYTRCPYSLKPISQVAKVNDEHIIPDSIGGVLEYKLRVDADKNAILGNLVDAPLVSSPLIAAQRLMHGIKSRSGDPAWKVRGKIKGTNKQVEVTFPSNGDTQVYVRRPIEMDTTGDKGNLTVYSKDQESVLRTLVENCARKGKTVVVDSEVSLGSDIEVDLSVDLTAIKRGLMKIAYAALYEYLGDAFLDDPLIPEWTKALFSQTAEEAMSARIRGIAFDVENTLSVMLPELRPYEHAVAIANLQQEGPVVAVSVFGRAFHSLLLVASETSNFGLSPLKGKIAICDTKQAKMRFLDFQQHFVETANKLALEDQLPSE